MEVGDFISHCDHESCDLGTFEYTCPSCKAFVMDYDMWWKEYEYEKEEIECPHCERKLTVEKIDHENVVSISTD